MRSTHPGAHRKTGARLRGQLHPALHRAMRSFKNLALSARRESSSRTAARRVRYFCARPARGSGVGSPGRRIGSRKRVGNSAPRETFRTGRRKARAESRFRWRTKRQPVRGTLPSPFEPALRAAVPVDAPLSVDIEDGRAACNPADGTAVDGIGLDSAHFRFVIGPSADGVTSRCHLFSELRIPRPSSARFSGGPSVERPDATRLRAGCAQPAVPAGARGQAPARRAPRRHCQRAHSGERSCDAPTPTRARSPAHGRR